MSDFPAVVVGAGAAGLAASWHLRRNGRRFVVLDAGARPGDVWRSRYDSLRLFTPARFCELPGLPMHVPPGAHPGKDEMADYLARYAERFDLPVRPGSVVRTHRVDQGRHRLSGDGFAIETDRLIVATGACRTPATPAFAAALAPAVRHLHSGDYRRPSDLPAGRVLVVGAGPAGADIALELSATHEVWLAGESTGHIPVSLVRSAVVRRTVYDRRMPAGRLGRLVRARLARRGGPLIWQTEALLRRVGVRRVPRVAGVRDGLPQLVDGRVLAVAAVVWCTGFRPGYGWMDARALGPHGWPEHFRGVSATLPGLGYVGLPQQNTLGSGFLGAMSNDAASVVARLGR
ncbi:NAD(P)/FAD-dependent oxidoreductase [Actinoplanes sp. M2I2]|uniref:flavin-containing monooxygenase n=1 Tax=Actinoplanes sp. M2I2 TaxID=1734444 RepID=UPI00201FFA75|nr:NAD(P)-binding domain-containing protein [Actinoplanes sp. M2I2]